MAEKGRRRRPGARPLVAHPDGSVETADPATTPLDVDGVATIAVGCLLWLVALVVLFFNRSTLSADGRTWWLWTCVAGFGLGLLGLQYCIRRRDKLTSRTAELTDPQEPR